MNHFDHEKLDVYQAAIQFVVLANDIITEIPRGKAHLADQLLRASTSICLNIAEGAGEFSAGDKARFYRMACRSATECAAILDVCGRIALVQQTRLTSARGLLLRVVSMLTKMARNLSGSRTGTGTGTGTGTDSGTGTGTGTG